MGATEAEQLLNVLKRIKDVESELEHWGSGDKLLAGRLRSNLTQLSNRAKFLSDRITARRMRGKSKDGI